MEKTLRKHFRDLPFDLIPSKGTPTVFSVFSCTQKPHFNPWWTFLKTGDELPMNAWITFVEFYIPLESHWPYLELRTRVAGEVGGLWRKAGNPKGRR